MECEGDSKRCIQPGMAPQCVKTSDDKRSASCRVSISATFLPRKVNFSGGVAISREKSPKKDSVEQIVVKSECTGFSSYLPFQSSLKGDHVFPNDLGNKNIKEWGWKGSDLLFFKGLPESQQTHRVNRSLLSCLRKKRNRIGMCRLTLTLIAPGVVIKGKKIAFFQFNKEN